MSSGTQHSVRQHTAANGTSSHSPHSPHGTQRKYQPTQGPDPHSNSLTHRLTDRHSVSLHPAQILRIILISVQETAGRRATRQWIQQLISIPGDLPYQPIHHTATQCTLLRYRQQPLSTTVPLLHCVANVEHINKIIFDPTVNSSNSTKSIRP